MEVEIDHEWREPAIQIEHKSRKEDVRERVFEYACYSWLLKRKPVWSIVIYTDEAVWRKEVPDSFWYAFNSQHRRQLYHFDVIKVKAERSIDLIQKHSLLCKLLALKANDENTDPEKLVYDIYRAAAEMKDSLTNDQLLLITRWVDTYKKISDQAFDRVKKEVDKEMIETTISEHIFNQGKAEGKAEGKIEGKAEGEIEGKIELLEKFFADGVLAKEQFEQAVAPLREELRKLREASGDSHDIEK